jgi:ParB family chromosome partitioning protein
MSADKPRRLGRGLEALLNARADAQPEPTTRETSSGADRGTLRRIPIAEIRPNPFQPRKHFNPEELADLESSLKVSGLLQPITVRPAPSGSGYELIAGERRLRAATRLEWQDIPAVVKPIDDRTLLTLALVENLQRADLNPLEQAEGYQRLIDEFSLTQQEVADVVGKDRSTVANMLRLLNLPEGIRKMLEDGQLTLGHARALLAVGNEQRMIELAKQTIASGLTVRDIEERARQVTTKPPRTTTKARTTDTAETTPEAKRIAEELRRYLQTDVRVALNGADRGSIAISFYSADDLDRLLELMMAGRRARA